MALSKGKKQLIKERDSAFQGANLWLSGLSHNDAAEEKPRKQKAEKEKPVMPIGMPSRVTRSTTFGRVTRSMTLHGKVKLVVSPLSAIWKAKKAKTSKKRKNDESEEKPKDFEDENAEEEEKSEKDGGTESVEQEEEVGDSENEN